MAIDTHGKRRSAQAVALGFLVMLPIADSTIAAEDRAHAAGLYSGLTYAAEASIWTAYTEVTSSTWTPYSEPSTSWTAQ